MIAYHFSRRQPKAKILIIDPKPKHSKQALFQQSWARYYPGMIEWLPSDITNGGVKAVDTAAMEVVTEDETFKADCVNVIPAQQAGAIARRAGLADASGWCPVAADTMASTLAPDVHLVGDAIIPGDMPKYAFAANSQAKACVNAILADLAGRRRFEPRLRNTCWSLLGPDNAVRVGADYQATADGIKTVHGFLSELDESDAVRAATAREALGWYSGIIEEVFA
jgi:NADPH-dependent 2,4-dienoyl-CoA reductase/sulfur reductase-like enzyme